MKRAEVVEGGTYAVKVGDRIAPVKLGRPYPYGAGGWYGRNLRTGREVVIRSAQRLRYGLERCSRCGQWARDLGDHERRRHEGAAELARLTGAAPMVVVEDRFGREVYRGPAGGGEGR